MLNYISPAWVALSYKNTAKWCEEQAVLARIHAIRTGEGLENWAKHLATRDKLLADLEQVLAFAGGAKVVEQAPKVDEAE